MTAVAEVAAGRDVAVGRDARERWLLLATCGAATTMFMAVGDILAALPHIGEALRSSQSDLQWIVNGYPLMLAALLLPSGFFADRYGRRRFLQVGLSILACGLVVASVAQSSGMLIAGLCGAGVGAGLAFPSTLATITVAIPVERRSDAVGLWAAAVPLGGIIGTLNAGVMVQLFSWHAAFVATALLAVACLTLTTFAVPETQDTVRRPLDRPGVLLSIVAVASLVIGINRGPVNGWDAPATLAWLIGGVAAFAAFMAAELRSTQPLLDVRLFALRSFGAGAAAIFAAFIGLYGLMLLSFQWTAYVLQVSPLLSIVAILPIAPLMISLAPIGPRLAARVGEKHVIALALMLGVLGSAVLATAGITSAYWTFALGLLIFGGSIGLGAGPLAEAITRELPTGKQGVASAVNDLSRELGATFGIAAAGTAFNLGYRQHLNSTLSSASDPILRAIHESPAAGLGFAGGADPADRSGYLELIASATNAGWTVALIAITIIFAIALIFFLFRFPAARPTSAGREEHL